MRNVNFNCKLHMQYACDKVSMRVRQSERWFQSLKGGGMRIGYLLIVASPVLPYACCTPKLRTTLRMFLVFRAASDDAPFVTSRMMPTDIFADEIMSIYNAMSTSCRRKEFMNRWLQRWDRSGKGLWHISRSLPSKSSWRDSIGTLIIISFNFLRAMKDINGTSRDFKLCTSSDFEKSLPWISW